MLKTPKQLIKEIKEQFDNSINRLNENVRSIIWKEAYGTIYEVIYNQGEPIRVLVDMDSEYRPNGTLLSEIYLWGATIDNPYGGIPIKLMTPIEQITTVYGTNLEKVLLGRSVKILYKGGEASSAYAYIDNSPATVLDGRVLYEPETCGKQYGKYSGV